MFDIFFPFQIAKKIVETGCSRLAVWNRRTQISVKQIQLHATPK